MLDINIYRLYIRTLCSIKIKETFLHTDVSYLHSMLSEKKMLMAICVKEENMHMYLLIYV